ncbi:uncharacterized protein LOC122391097 [Amphibalanus amphitrite]|uniref:uncharacterized protein LOC122391097 n=1 Tax=Amphibalanus amphitrite TaxID=1232801 RepID=UPI001C927614|nr:uncharacterized protein LOC122391097 [Amphibalanus amphitrite]XP_043240673.1 uncharacterized protein LOC122391097 [Amphibalanus amphitrite]
MAQVAVSVTAASGQPVTPAADRARRPRRLGCCGRRRPLADPESAEKSGCRPPPWRSSLLIGAIIVTALAVCVLVPLTLDEGVRPLFSGSYAPATCHVASVVASNGTCSCRLCQTERSSCLAFTAHVAYASHLMLRRRNGWDVEHALLSAGPERCHAWLACEQFLRETAVLGSNLSCLVRQDEDGALAVPRQQHGRAAWLFLLLLLPLLVLAALLVALYCQLCGPPARRRRAVRAWRRAAAQVRQRQRSYGRSGGAPTPEEAPPPPPMPPVATRPTLLPPINVVAKRE